MERNQKALFSIIIILLVAILVTTIIICDSKFDELENSFSSQISGFSSTVHSLNYQISNLENNLMQMLAKKESLITDYKLETDGPVDSTLNSKVTLTITPKNFSENTVVTFFADNYSVKMQRAGNTFKGTLTLPAYKYYDRISFTLEADGISSSETISENVEIAHNLYNIFLSKYDYNNCTLKDNKITLTGDIHYSFDTTQNIKSMKAFIKINGQKVWQEDMPLNTVGEQTYALNQTLNAGISDNISFHVYFTTDWGLIYTYRIFTLSFSGENLVGVAPDCILYSLSNESGVELYRDNSAA